MRNTISRILLLVILCAGVSSCQRFKKQLAFSEKDADAPQYTTEFQKNTSPVK